MCTSLFSCLVLFLSADSELRPITILRDTGAAQSIILDCVRPFTAVKLAEKQNSKFLLKYYKNSNYILI